jgi:hypothetical protein
MQTDIDDAQRRHAVEQAAKRAGESDITQYILPHCSGEELDSVFPHLVSRGLWECVGMLLKKGVSGKQRRHAIEQAANLAGQEDLTT